MKELVEYSQMHECCPKDWRKVRDITGSHELDAVIQHACKNADVPSRLKMYCEREATYGPLTGYNGYHNYSGDA